jgi:hypothetical protein
MFFTIGCVIRETLGCGGGSGLEKTSDVNVWQTFGNIWKHLENFLAGELLETSGNISTCYI